MPTRRACDVCSKRKIRCLLPRAGSSCDWCKNQGLECAFRRESKSSHRLTPAAVQHLLRRLDHLEGKQATNAQTRSQTSATVTDGLIFTADRNTEPLPTSYSSQAAQPSPQASSPCRTPQPLIVQPYARYCTEEAVKRWLGHSWYFKGLSVCSPDGEKWLESKTGQPFTFKSLSLLKSRSTFQDSMNPGHEAPSLPNKSETQELANMYFQSRIYHMDPILDPVLFNRTIQIAYDSRIDEACCKFAAACIWAFHALMSRLHAKDAGTCATSQIYERNCLSQASFISDESGIDQLQTLLILYIIGRCSPRHHARQRLLSLACHIIIDISGHCDVSDTTHAGDDSNQRLRRHIRGLFWLCYRLDKDAALRQGRPPILTQEHCDLIFPDDYGNSWLLPDNYAASMMIPYLSAASRLSLIKENVCRLLFSRSATSTDDNLILLNIRHLDEELEKWRSGLAHPIQPTLAISADYTQSSTYFGSSRDVWSLVLQLDYSYTLIMIHTTIRKCNKVGSEPGSISEDLHQVVHSSINLSLEAARSTLHLLRIAATTMGTETLLYVIRYVPLAAMALFLNVVIHPVDSRGPVDLVILTTFISAIQGLDLNEANDEDVEDIQRLCEFMAELVRLGNGTIWKAKIEARKQNVQQDSRQI